MNDNKGENISVPDHIITDRDDVDNNEIVDLEVLLEKLSKLKLYTLNHKCYCNIELDEQHLLGNISKRLSWRKWI